MPHNFDMDDHIWLKLEQVISKISFSSSMKSFFMLLKMLRKDNRKRGGLHFFGTACICQTNMFFKSFCCENLFNSTDIKFYIHKIFKLKFPCGLRYNALTFHDDYLNVNLGVSFATDLAIII